MIIKVNEKYGWKMRLSRAILINSNAITCVKDEILWRRITLSTWWISECIVDESFDEIYQLCKGD